MAPLMTVRYQNILKSSPTTFTSANWQTQFCPFPLSPSLTFIHHSFQILPQTISVTSPMLSVSGSRCRRSLLLTFSKHKRRLLRVGRGSRQLLIQKKILTNPVAKLFIVSLKESTFCFSIKSQLLIIKVMLNDLVSVRGISGKKKRSKPT